VREANKPLKALLARLSDAPPDPMVPEWILLADPGAARDLSFQIAHHLGFCAQIRFLSFSELLEVLGGPRPDIWQLFELIPALGLGPSEPQMRLSQAQELLYRMERLRWMPSEKEAPWDQQLDARLEALMGPPLSGCDPLKIPHRLICFGFSALSPLAEELLSQIEALRPFYRFPLCTETLLYETIRARDPVWTLKEQLQQAFQEMPRLELPEIGIFCDDPEEWHARISAQLQLPLSVADRPRRATDPVGPALEAALRALERMEAPEVLALLTHPVIHQHFWIDPGALPRLEIWVKEAGIYWGADLAHRAEVIPSAIHSWRFGLDRLLLGIALGPGEARLFAGVRPESEIEGETALLGRFIKFIEVLMEAQPLERADGPSWAAWLNRLRLNLSCQRPEYSRSQERFREALKTLYRAPKDLSRAEVLSWLGSYLDSPDPETGHGTGRITLARLRRHRPLSFRAAFVLDSENPKALQELAAQVERLWVIQTDERLEVLPWKGPVIKDPRPFFPSSLPRREALESLKVQDLERFLLKPIQTGLRQALGLWMGKEEMPAQGRATAKLSGLERWHIGDELLRWCRLGVPLEPAYEAMRASGRLSPGRAGRRLFDSIAEEAGQLAEAAYSIGGPPRSSLELKLPVMNLELLLRAEELFEVGPMRVRFSRAEGKSLLSLWIQHLVLQAAGYSLNSHLLGRGWGGPRHLWIRPLPQPEAQRLLEDLIQLYRLGRRFPLLFFPGTSGAYISALRQGEPPWRAAEKAERVWRFEGGDLERVLGDWSPAQGPQPQHLPLPPGRNFHELALTVWGPIYDNMGERKL